MKKIQSGCQKGPRSSTGKMIEKEVESMNYQNMVD